VNKIDSVAGKNILLLQGPMGNFFKKLDSHLRKNGAKTYRIGFNAGDAFFSHRDNYIPFKQDKHDWADFIRKFLKEKKIDIVFLFGDCRYYQSIAISEAKRIKRVQVFVFEEGYIRPHYITMERWGVNAYSLLSKKREFYEKLPLQELEKPNHAHASKSKLIMSATVYYFVSNLFSFLYPNYEHHREMSALKEAFYGVRGLFRKIIYPLLYERGMEEKVRKEYDKNYFFIPLQTHTDFQILIHSNFLSIEKFIIFILESFAHSGLTQENLIFKHHPVDRGRKNYRDFILEQATMFGLRDRVIILYDTNLPTLLKHAKGCVTVNSTVGLSAIYHGTPTKTVGKAIYDIDGLTAQKQTLLQFFKNPKAPEEELVKKFYSYIIQTTQLNGSFYGLFPNI